MFGPAPINDVAHPDVCWAPGTPASTVAAYERTHPDDDNSVTSPFRVLGQGRWTRTATDGDGLKQGQLTTLTYSFVPDGLALPNDSGEPSNLQARLTSIYGSKDAWLAIFARIGAALSKQSGLTYVYEPMDDGAPFGGNSSGSLGVRGDLRISGHRLDGNYGVLAYNYSPDNGDMVIDTSDVFFEDKQQDSLGFRNTVTHEFGHGVGLGHTCPINQTKLMEPFVSLNFDGPQFDDIRGLQRFYGDGAENDDTIETAQNLGTLSDGKLTIGDANIVSIDDAADTDFFKFVVPVNKSLGIVMRPKGEPYLEGAQNQDASCSEGTMFNPKTVNDLGFELLRADSSGVYVSVATLDSNPAGGTETFNPANYPTGGQFALRAFGGTIKDVQTYAMDITVGAPVTNPTPGPTPTAGPTPTPGPTAGPTPTPTPDPQAIRPIVDLNGPNSDGSPGQDSPVANGIDATSQYFFRVNGTDKSGGPQNITPPETFVLSDISGQNIPVNAKGKAIVEARVELTPDRNDCGVGDPTKINGIAPDNCYNDPTKRNQEVLSIPAPVLKNLNDRGANLSVNYDIVTQILTIKGGIVDNRRLDENRRNFEDALLAVQYENKRVNPTLYNFRTGLPEDRIVTYVVDTDNDDTNNMDSRFAPQEPGNPKQSKPAVLTLQFVEQPSLVVTTNSDVSANRSTASYNDEQTSLREAIQFANASGGGDITFQPGVTGTINLASQLPKLNAPTTITGPGARKLSVTGAGQQSAGGNNSSVFRINSTVTISGLTITGGTAAPRPIQGTTDTEPATGGGIFVDNGNSLTVNACTISGNSAAIGGGIGVIGGGSLTLTNSTISGNTASQTGGGLYLDTNTGDTPGAVAISNSTISGNSGVGIAQASGSSTITLATITNNAPTGIVVTGGTARINNSIVSGNASDDDVKANGGTFNSGGYNIVGGGNAVNSFTVAKNDKSNLMGNTAGLSALGNNGGQTDTHALFAGSPAIDGGDPAYANPPATDQRGEGFVRPINAIVDVGAFEKQDNKPIVNPVITPRNPTTNQTITVNANSDTTNLTYEFSVNGVVRQAAGPSNTFDLSQTRNGDRGDTVSVLVTATTPGGTTTGTDSVIVANSAPSFNVTLTATNQFPNDRTGEPLTQSVLKAAVSNASDPDGDTINYSYVWKVNGVTIFQERGNTIDLSKAGNGDRDDVVSVEVTGTDTTGRNTPAAATTKTASVSVGNTKPVGQSLNVDVNAGQMIRVLLPASDVDTKQPTRNDPRAIDTKFSFLLRSRPLRGTASIEVNTDGRYVLVYMARKKEKGKDYLRIVVDDQNTQKSRFKRSQPVIVTVRVIAAPAANSSSSAPAQSSNPSAGSS